MKNKARIFLVAAGFVGLFFCVEIMSMGIQEEKPDKEWKGKLVRIDLLKGKEDEIKPPLRNIFTGRKIQGASDSEGRETPGIISSLVGFKRNVGEEESQSQEADLEKKLVYDIKYLGYIASFGKNVALILYKGEAVAVEKGSVLPGGIEIIDISLDKVTIKSSGSDKIAIKLEGEEK
jgi:hypothetical protein